MRRNAGIEKNKDEEDEKRRKTTRKERKGKDRIGKGNCDDDERAQRDGDGEE